MSDMQQAGQYLDTVLFPVTKQELIDNAKHRNVPEDIIEAFRRLPERNYGSPMDVMHTLII